MRLLLTVLVAIGCSASNPSYRSSRTEPDGGRVDVDVPDLERVVTSADMAETALPDLAEPAADADTSTNDAELSKDGDTTVRDLLSSSSVGDLSVPPTCALPGACAPGTQETTDCQLRTCGADCKWSSWALKNGYQCCATWTQGCNAGVSCGHTGTQSCNASHQWGTCTC